ncbi:MAG: glutamate--tRNA ligase [Anaerolineales bacterium]
MTELKPARVRYAPSPTGRFHIGGARTALYNYLLARQSGGQFIIRIEDTDRKRFVPGSEEEILQSLDWLGLGWDEGPDLGGPHAPYRQSERVELYRRHAEQLVELGFAYFCFCSPERLATLRQDQERRRIPPRYDRLCRRLAASEAAARREAGESHVVRLKVPESGRTIGVDRLRGEIQVENSNLDDAILLKSDGLPVYHLAAMVDDRMMGITHVLRSSEWLPTFPLHVLIYQAFGWEQPVWVHLSVFLNPSGKGKMSKRDAVSGASSIFPLDLREQGYLPEAMVNWLALMGWSYDDRTELFGLDDLVQKFSLDRLNPSPAAVNYGKLDHFNGIHIRSLPPVELARRLAPIFARHGLAVSEADLSPLVPLIQERIRTLDEAVEMAGFMFRGTVAPAAADLIGQGMTASASAAAAREALNLISGLVILEVNPLEAELRALADKLSLKVGQLFGILRVMVTGQRVSPPLIETMVLLGKPRVVSSLARAIEELESAG